ncbi:hypothetical protein Tco_1511076, partial [Tanacetum coccineum]
RIKGGNEQTNQPRQPTRVLQNPSADMGSSIGMDDGINDARVLQDVTDHVNPLNNKYARFSASVGEPNLRSVMNPSIKTKYNVEENVWSGYLATSRFRSTDPSLPEGDCIRVSTQAGRFVSTSSCMDKTGPNVVSLFTGFGEALISSSFTTVVPDDIGTSSKGFGLTFPARANEPIVQAVSINANPNSYAGVASVKQSSATKGEATKFNFTK